MTRESESIIRRYKDELWSQGKMELVDELLTPDFAFNSPGQAVDGRAAVVGYLSYLRSAFPDLHFTVHDLILGDDRAACTWTLFGTQEQEFLGFPADGQRVELPGVSIIHIAEGRLCQEQVYWDRQSLLEQLQPAAEPA